jgi:ATP-dependent Clp protease ATP-binding subunit ClpC
MLCLRLGQDGWLVTIDNTDYKSDGVSYAAAAAAVVCNAAAASTPRLVEEGFNPAYGARPLRRAIMRLIEDCLAERILCGDIKEGDVVIMDVEPDGAIAVLAGDKKMRQVMDATPAGIS